jgi:RNA polymerase sigma-70 factor (ECF subfamily)
VENAPATDAEAITSAIGGDGAAFGTLVDRYQEVAFRAAYLIVRDAQAAEDVAQEAFVRAYRRLRTFRREDPFRPWLLRIVTNLALNEVRSRGRRAGLVQRLGFFASPAVDPPASVQLEAADEAASLARALADLPDDDRVILHLRFFLDLPEREIAVAIGRPAGTVKSRLHRAGKRLREVIEEKYPELRERTDG